MHRWSWWDEITDGKNRHKVVRLWERVDGSSMRLWERPASRVEQYLLRMLSIRGHLATSGGPTRRKLLMLVYKPCNACFNRVTAVSWWLWARKPSTRVLRVKALLAQSAKQMRG